MANMATFLLICVLIQFFKIMVQISQNNVCVLQCRLIVSQMSNMRCEVYHWMTPIFCISVAIGLWLPIFERPILYILCILTTLTHWHYGTRVVSSFFSFKINFNFGLHHFHDIFCFLCRFNKCVYILIEFALK